MKLVVFGLTVSSSWGNGHATLWRGLLRALARAGHSVVFFERDVPYYAANRDLHEIPGGELVLYSSWEEALPLARHRLGGADAVMVTSYCPDGIAASELCLSSRVPVKVFYDMDTPVTLEKLRAGEPLSYIGPDGLAGFDLVLSFTGGAALDELRTCLGAVRVAPLYGSVDPEFYAPVPPRPEYTSDLSYLGTFSADRQSALEELFLRPARVLPSRRFTLGGSLYPRDFAWTDNLWYFAHIPPPAHPAFYSSSRLTLNVTRGPMAAMGYCPSGRLFEASACGVPIITDAWQGLSDFFEPGLEILLVQHAEDVLAALSLPPAQLAAIGRAGRARTLGEHTAEHRARELISLLTALPTARETTAAPPSSSHRAPPLPSAATLARS